MEARDIPETKADALVCDGFTGNIVLKLTEGIAAYLLKGMKTSIMSNTKGKIGGMLIKDNLKSFKKQFDYAEYGGAPFLGVKGGIIKAHGSSDAFAIKNAVRQSIKFIENAPMQPPMFCGVWRATDGGLLLDERLYESCGHNLLELVATPR